MSLKDLFKNRESFKVSPLKSTDDVAREIGESSEFLEEFRKDRDRFIPPVDYNDPASFAIYGLAEKYYDDAIKRIYNTYPYDGSLREKTAWHNSSSYVDKHVFENEYPRTNGYAIISADGWDSDKAVQIDGYGDTSSPEYIVIHGGPNTGSSMASLRDGFAESNIYDVASNRESNLEYNLDPGLTVEFWLKKDAFDTSGNTEKEVIFDLWNGHNSSSADYGRLRVELDGTRTAATYATATLTFTGYPTDGDTVTLIDSEGNTVVYKFNTSNHHYDGRLHPDLDGSINVGISPFGPDDFALAAARLVITINYTTSYDDNAQVLNTTAVWGGLPEIGGPLVSTAALTQGSTGYAGNTAIAIGSDVITGPTRFSGGASETPFLVTAMSGTSGFYQEAMGTDVSIASLADWNHYAVSLINGVGEVTSSFYVNGALNQVAAYLGNAPLNEVTSPAAAATATIEVVDASALDTATGTIVLYSTNDTKYILSIHETVTSTTNTLTPTFSIDWTGEAAGTTTVEMAYNIYTAINALDDFTAELVSGASGLLQKIIITQATRGDSGNVTIVGYGALVSNPAGLIELGGFSGGYPPSGLNAYIGALRTAPSGAAGALESISAGAGKFSGSLDEFRYWKIKRTSEDIGRYWFTHVHGGTNTDLNKYNDRNPVDLGVYFKFNEGITGVAATDATVLDYSGRYTNGAWVGYDSNSRNVGSAIVSASAAPAEFKDPIVYSFHPDVSYYSSQKQLTGSGHDVRNNGALYNMLPRWVIDEDVKYSGNIKNLTQILASYFDTLHLQIQALPTLREATFSTYASASISSSAKPLPFADRLLEGLGLETPELFIDAEIIEKLISRDETRGFKEKLHDVKNLIYHNIYNNLAHIYKSKGTEKSFRNLVRCFGFDDELIKLNIYGQDALYKFKDNFRSTVINKKTIDFNDPTRFWSTIYQYSGPTNTDLGYITGSNFIGDMPCTFEAEIVFPRKKKPYEIGYFNTTFFSSSLFGAHSASNLVDENGFEDLTWPAGDASNFQVYAIRTSSLSTDIDTKDAYFMLTSSNPYPIPTLTSSVFSDVYDNTKWNFAVRLKHDKYEQNNMVAGTSGSDRTYTVEFYGVNTILDEVMNEFVVSSSIGKTWAEKFIEANKRMYMGAHRTNFTGDVLQRSDVKASSLRYWYDYVGNDVIKAHAKDPTNYGLRNPYRNLSLFHTGANYEYTPSIESLALNWDFETVTGSDAAGRFNILDYSSGSLGVPRCHSADTQVCLTIEGNNLNYVSTAPIHGFQFNHNGCVTGAPSGDAIDDGITVTVGEASVIGISFAGGFVPAGTGTLLLLEGTPTRGCLSNFVFVTTDGSELTVAFSEAVHRYGSLGSITKKKYPGRGDYFPAASTSSIEKTYFHIAKQQLPEQIFSDDMINLVDEDSVTFTRESRPTQFFFSAEKSMYQTISEEMVDMFATIVDFNNLIGEPVHRYRSDYKDLTKLRQLFFEKINNTADLDRYVDFYKWIDNSISTILRQLMPVSANVSENLRTMIENHILERNKYLNKLSLLRMRRDLEDIMGVPSTPGAERPFTRRNKILPDMRRSSFGYQPPPISGLPSENCYWWLNRAERNHPSITSGVPAVDVGRAEIATASSPDIGAYSRHGFEVGGDPASEKRGTTTIPRFQGNLPIHGGTNYRAKKNLRYAIDATTLFGNTTLFMSGDAYPLVASNNFVLFRKSDIEDFPDCSDEIFRNELDKKKWKFIAFNNSDIKTPGSYDYNILKGDMVIPFNLYKHNQTLSGGYHDQINNNFKEGVDFTNIHVDVVGPDNEVPMQSPFTEKHVGGLQHRHVDINRFDSSKNTANNLDDQTTRPEAWFLLIGTRYDNEGVTSLVGPTYTTTDKYDLDTPRARLYRAATAKSVVNIRNIRNTNSVIGNYTSSMDYVNTVGRRENNKFLKENGVIELPSRFADSLPQTTNLHSLIGVGGSTEGNIFGPSAANLTNTSNRIATDTQFTLPRRDLTGSNFVIVGRFSSPGGPEVSSRGFLDNLSEEYSAYNALPYKNLSVRTSGSGEANSIRSAIMTGAGRDGLRTLLSRPCGQFGIENQYGSVRALDYNTTASFHKINRNRLKRIEYLDNSSTTITASVYDNFWVQHHIPRSDLQYSWLTASFESYPAKAEIYGHAPADGMVSSSVAGVVPAYNFVTASHVTNSNGTVTSFAGYNTIVKDGIVSSENLLSASSFPNDYLTSLGDMNSVPEAVNAVMLLRHGPYQWPSWKQIRGGEHAIARYQKKNNIFSFTTPLGSRFTPEEAGSVPPEIRGGQLRQFVEPSITSNYKPIIHVLDVNRASNPFDPYEDSTSPGSPVVEVGLKYSYANEKDMFPTDEINFLLNLSKTSTGMYGSVTDLYLGPTSEHSSVNKFKLLSYRQTVYPQPENAYLSGSRSRLTFIHPEWKSNRGERKKADTTNSMSQVVTSQSMWPLDARDDFATAAGSAAGSGDGAGELQNGYTLFHEGVDLGVSTVSIKSVKYSSRAFLTASYPHSNGALAQSYVSSSVISFWFRAHGDDISINDSSSFVSKGKEDTTSTVDYMTYDIRLEQDELYANVGSVRGNTSEEIVFKKVVADSFGSAAGALDTKLWATASNDISIKQDTIVGTYAVVLSGSGDIPPGYGVYEGVYGDKSDRWFKTIHRYQGPLTVAYKFIAGLGHDPDGTSPYDPTGLDLKRPEYDADVGGEITRDSLFLQYSTDGTTWTDVYEHRGQRYESGHPVSSDFVGGTWIEHTSTISTTDLVYLRWFQNYFGARSEDQWAVNDVSITSDNHSLSDDNWHHVALAWYYNSATEHSMSLYVDGERRTVGSTGTHAGPDTEAFGSSVIVGGNPPLDTHSGAENAIQGYKGYMDELTFFTGSLSSSVAADTGWSGSLMTSLYNSGNPIDVTGTSLSPLTVLSHYRMGEHANDGELAKHSGFIQDTTSTGVSAMTGNLSASVSSEADSGFSAETAGIFTEAPYNSDAGQNTNIFGPFYARRIPERDSVGTELGYFAGDTLWEAGAQSGKDPFYNSYDDYREEMRGMAKDYTIIPEFRMSEHIEHYLDTSGGNFLAENKDWLQLTGAAANVTSSAEDDFFKTYTNTDFMKHFDIIKQEHSAAGHEPTSFVLRCNAVMKFTPYEGFYPASRTLQLATLFSKSYAERINFKDPSATSTAASFGNQVSFRTFTAPLFGPGVLYNSIKSGIAVDHPIMTAPFTVDVPDYDAENEWSGSYRISSSFGYRVPFEALVEPENYLGGATIVDYEPHISASYNSTASWDGSGSPLFKLGVNNFIAEVPKFFLRNQGVTSFVSAKDNDGRHFSAEAGKEYRMRIVLTNARTSKRSQLESTVPRDNSGGQALSLTGAFFTSPTTTMYSRRSAFGPPVHAEYIKFNESYEPFTPPHMDGYADVEYVYRPTESGFKTVGEIISNLTLTYYRVGEQYFTTVAGALPTSVAALNQMHVSASLNLLDVIKMKRATYDPVTGVPISVEDDATAPSLAIVQPKWETPMLEFKNALVTLPTHGAASVSKGMWHQYGTELGIGDGVFLGIQDLTEEEKTSPTLTGSLADLMGFSRDSVKLGQVAEERIIREAVVAVPFIQRGGRKEFFNISRERIDAALRSLRLSEEVQIADVGGSIIDMVNAMQRYVIPPKFDFLTNGTVNPVAMYLFEFEHKLVRKDLIDIWQNLPPEIGRKFETKSVIVNHKLLENELMKEIKDSLRWMVFKVKQKASDNYFKMLTDSIQEEGFVFESLKRRSVARDRIEFDYSYNWPYDYFSLIELVKLDTEIVIENNSDEE